MSDPVWIDAGTVAGLVSIADAIDVLTAAVTGGLDPAGDPPRVAVSTRSGQLLVMPSEVGDRVGVKIATIAPGNPALGRPRVQALYVLLDSETLAPLALLDGAALTSLRTPAVSALAVRHLAAADASRLVVFGSGPQAWGHVAAVRSVRPITDVVVVARDPGRTRDFAARVAATGVRTSVGAPGAVGEADVVVCATTAGEPLFAAEALLDAACVVAVGAHEPDRRELAAELLGRATVVVEDRSTALREAGDVVIAVAGGALDQGALLSLADVVTGAAAADPTRPRVFKSVGMAWEDLVVAAEIYRRLLADRRRT